MSDTMWRNRELSDEAKKLEAAGQFAQAAELYKQSYELYQGAFVASRYIRCLRKAGKSDVAVDFGRQLPKQLQDDTHVHSAVAWALYDVYLKKDANKDDNEVADVEREVQNSADFQKMQKAARYILKKSSDTEDILRIRTIFAICNEAKQRGQWQVMYNFAVQLAPERLSTEQQERDGRKLPSDYQRWLYLMIRSLLELKRYTECLDFADKGIERYPGEKLFHWWHACAKKALGQVAEALSALERIDTRFPKEWYIQRDIADGYTQLQKYDDAWVWFSKAACSGDLKASYKMFEQMSMLLEHLGRWQEAYAHLQLACAIAERENWQRPAEALRGQLFQFRKRHAGHLSFGTDGAIEPLPILFRRCKDMWQATIYTSRPQGKGCITIVNEEKKFGSIKADNGDIHFWFRDVIGGITPVVGMEVEFEVEKSYDQKKQRDSTKAVNVRPVRSSA